MQFDLEAEHARASLGCDVTAQETPSSIFDASQAHSLGIDPLCPSARIFNMKIHQIQSGRANAGGWVGAGPCIDLRKMKFKRSDCFFLKRPHFFALVPVEHVY